MQKRVNNLVKNGPNKTGNQFFGGFIWTIIHHYSPFNAGGVPWEFKKKGMGFIWIAMIEMLLWDRSLF